MDTLRIAKILADDTDLCSAFLGVPKSAYRYDARGASFGEGTVSRFPLCSEGNDAPTGIIRELQTVSDGVMLLKAVISLSKGTDGLEIRLYGGEERDVLRLYTAHGCLTDGHTVSVPLECGRMYLRVLADLDARTADIYVNGAFAGTSPLGASTVRYVRIGTTAGSTVSVDPGRLYIAKDMCLDERYCFEVPGKVPVNAAVFGDAEVRDGDLVLGKDAAVTYAANGTAGTVFEAFLFRDTPDESVKVRFCHGGRMMLCIGVKDGCFTANGAVLRQMRGEMWYRLRIECSEKATVIRVNGKCQAELPPVMFDKVTFEGDRLHIDRVKLFYSGDPADYCPMPVIPEKKTDAVLGMNMCSLWRTGSHVGWDIITPYEELRPVLGYYDEGLPEVADYELKFMLEHGVDFQMYCWYASESDAPMKTTMLSEALHDGYFNCRYSDLSHFAILWEAAAGKHPASGEAFRRYFVPYFIEHFFSDTRYMRIDNRAVMGIFCPEQLIRDFGSPEAFRTELDYLRNEVTKLGYDGMIILACGAPSEVYAECGFDGVYVYSHGKDGSSADYTLRATDKQIENSTIHVVPTASTGFNNVAWAGTRSESITPDALENVLKAYRDQYLPSFAGDAWHHKLVMLSNWNEYGEGTYFMPCEKLHGFGLLDAVRSVFTEDVPHTDVFPTGEALLRLSALYPQTRRMLKDDGRCVRLTKTEDLCTYRFPCGSLEELYMTDSLEASVGADGTLCGISHGGDPKLIMKRNVYIDARGADYARIYGTVSEKTTVQIFYKREGDADFAGARVFSIPLAPGQTSAEAPIRFPELLEKPVTSLRIDPAMAPGVTFALSSFALCRGLNEPAWIVDGEKINGARQLVTRDGRTYLPFDMYSPLAYRLHLYYEYDCGVLTFYGKDTSVSYDLAAQTDAFVQNGLAYLPLDGFCRSLGIGYTYEEPCLTFVTKKGE